MGRKNRDDAPNPNSIPNKDIIQRLNFLYQASSYLNGLGAAHTSLGHFNAAVPSVRSSSGQMKWEESAGANGRVINATDMQQPPGKRKATVHDLAGSYVKSMKIIGQKTNVKMDPTIKRTLCKGCNMLLMPGVTAKVRVKPLPSHGHAVGYTCLNCSFSRRIPAPPTREQTDNLSGAQLTKETTRTSGEMDIDPVDELLEKVKEEVSVNATSRGKRAKPRNQTRKKKTIKPRPLPFFEREGHILFVGNERLDQNVENGK